MKRPLALGGDLAEAGSGAAREVPARLGPRIVGAAHELARALLDAERRAVTVDHPHVRAVAIEPDEIFGAVPQARVIVTRDADKGIESRKAAHPANETFRDGFRHLVRPRVTLRAKITACSRGAAYLSEVASSDSIELLHADIAREARRLHVLHAARLECQEGCKSCCVDDLTVFDVEAERIRARHAQLLATGVPHPEGACAFLDELGACRVYADRPYVCRTQGLPLRWVEERDGAAVELRDICPLNEDGPPIEELSADACWGIGPVEERLANLQRGTAKGAQRTPLRDLFHGRARR